MQKRSDACIYSTNIVFMQDIGFFMIDNKWKEIQFRLKEIEESLQWIFTFVSSFIIKVLGTLTETRPVCHLGTFLVVSP